MNIKELKEKYGKTKVRQEWKKTDKLSIMIVTFFGSGMSPKAPGTVGSFTATLTSFLLAYLGLIFFDGKLDIKIISTPFYLNLNILFLILSIISFFIPIYFVNKAMKDTNTKDPGWIVIDEVCGIFTSLIFLPSYELVHHPWILALMFVLFRFFDILKPLGIHKAEKFSGAWGVMVDDLLGGIYTCILGGIIATTILNK